MLAHQVREAPRPRLAPLTQDGLIFDFYAGLPNMGLTRLSKTGYILEQLGEREQAPLNHAHVCAVSIGDSIP